MKSGRITVEWILEIHLHADHLTAAPFLKGELGGRTGIGAAVVEVRRHYGPGEREIAWETTVGEQRRADIHVRDGVGEEEYVAMRTAHNRTLDMPALMQPAVQVNMRAGYLLPPRPMASAVSRSR